MRVYNHAVSFVNKSKGTFYGSYAEQVIWVYWEAESKWTAHSQSLNFSIMTAH